MIMDLVSKRINDLLKERKMSRYVLSKKCPDVSRTSIYNAADGSKRATMETISTICNGLEISLRDFFDFDNDVTIHLSDKETAIIEKCRSLSNEDLKRLEGYLDALTK